MARTFLTTVLLAALTSTGHAAPPTFTVTVRFDGRPAPGVTVWPLGATTRHDERAKAWPPVRSDGQGRVTLPAPDAAGNGYRWLFARDARGRPGSLGLTHVSDLVLEPALRIDLPEVGEARGRVVDADGWPVVGATVRTIQFSWANERGGPVLVSTLPAELAGDYVARTDGDGRFALRGMPLGGRVGVSASAAGFGTLDYADWHQDQPCELRLGRAGGLRVRIEGAEEPKQVAGMALRLSSGTARGAEPVHVSIFRPVTLGADGTATVENLPPGRYGLELDYGTGSTPYRPKASATVDVAPGATAEVTLAVEPAAQLRGRVIDKVTGAGIGGARIALPGVRPGGWRFGARADATTDADGRYVAYVPAGKWALGDVWPAPTGYLPYWNPSKNPVQVGTGATHKFDDVALEPAVPVEGVVLDAAGRPVEGVQVFSAHTLDSVPTGALSDAAGRFTLRNLGAGGRTALRARTAAATTDGAVPFDTAGAGPLRLVLSPAHAARLRGTVVDAAGKPVADAAVRVEWCIRGPEYGQGVSIETYRTDAAGRFETQALWPGDEYLVHVMADGLGWSSSGRVRGIAGQVREFAPIVLRAPDAR